MQSKCGEEKKWYEESSLKKKSLFGPKHSNLCRDLLTSNSNIAREYCQNYRYDTRGIIGNLVKENVV